MKARMFDKDLAIFSLTLRRILRERKTIFTVIVLLIPSVISLVWVSNPGDTPDARDFFTGMAIFLYLFLVIILLSLINATTLLHAELHDGAGAYLVTRPIHRVRISMAKFAGFALSNAAMLFVSMFLSYSIAYLFADRGSYFSDIDEMLKLWMVLSAGLLVYGAFFMALGAVVKHPTVIGLGIGFFWEVTIPLLSQNVSRLTVSYYLMSWMDALVPTDAIELTNGLSGAGCAATLLSLLLLFLGAGAVAFTVRDVE